MTRSAHHPSPDERTKHGKAARRAVPRASHAAWQPAADRRPALDILLEQASGRLHDLVPVRHGRMLTSPFAFFRGAAAVMAADLAATPTSGLRVQLCGDAHISNFGGFGSPERAFVFDLNDFDETARGPWEWDLKRLAASVAIAGRDLGLSAGDRRGAVVAAVRAYREAMRNFAAMGDLAVWYARVDAERILAEVSDRASARERKAIKRRLAAAQSKDHQRALSKLTERVNGRTRIVSDPPRIVPIEELLPLAASEALEEDMRGLLRVYRRSLKSDRRHLLEGYRYVHMARKVVGVGSVGTRAWVILLEGRDGDDPLFLQVKEATASVLEPFAGRDPADNHGRRVVQGQWLMQAASDIFLGWLRTSGKHDAVRDYYVRQLWDWKASADLASMSPERLSHYAWLCGWTLARAHARSGDRIAIAAYLGAGDAFERALAEFAEAYADQNERDHAALADAASAGLISVERDA